MQCPRCHTAASVDAKFCPQCGAPLLLVCAACQSSNAADHRFCKHCGHPLTAPKVVEMEPGGTAEAERRQLTVMFCDLVGSTTLSEQLDPEDLRDVVRRYQEVCAGVIAVHGGHVAQYLGDGLLVYFGYPQAHEDDARRAVRSGLGIVDAVRALHDPSRRAATDRLAVRIGIHTGPVVVGRIGIGQRYEDLAIGETPNVAARLQATADPDTVVISAATRHLVRGFFACESLGLRTLRGVSQPLELSRVLGEAAESDGPQSDDVAGPTSLVGREPEIGVLLSRWEMVKGGRGQVAVLTGEPGIGKSRLVHTMRARLAAEPHTVLEAHGSTYSQGSALHSTIDLMRGLFGFRAEDPPEERRARLVATLERHRLPVADAFPLLAALLALPDEDFSATAPQTPQVRRQHTLEVILRLILSAAAERPVLLIVEDLHWIDPSTLEVLTLIAEHTTTAALFMLLTARPEFTVPWPSRLHVSITLTRLSRDECGRMAQRVAGGKMLPAEVLGHIVARTDGIPLFVEELTKTVLESGLLRDHGDRWELTGPLPPLAIPATLRDSLMARLDRQEAAKSIAQVAAVLGRQFSHELLQAVWPAEADALERGLARLVAAELLYPLDVAPRTSYVFKHGLIQDVAYESLLRSTRQRHHRRTAEALVERFPATAESQPELVAHHFSEAGVAGAAITYWQRAARRAVGRSANTEAVGHVRRALDLLRREEPDTKEHLRLELELQTTMGAALMAADGYAAPEVERAYERARDLCERLGDESQVFAALRGLWGLHFVRANLERAQTLGQQCLALARRSRTIALVWSHYMLGATHLELGQPAVARAHFEEGLAAYDPERRPVQRALQDPGVACLSYMATGLWLQGYPDRARNSGRQAIALARTLSHPFSLAFALGLAAVITQFRHEADETLALATAAGEVASEHGLAFFQAWASILKGWALAAQGRTEEGLDEQRRGLAAYRETGAALAEPYFLALIADTYRRSGQIVEGLDALADAVSLVARTKERWIEGELERLQGELRLASSPPRAAEAERHFQRALELARAMEAPSPELRAAMSLGRLWRSQGRIEQAQTLVAGVYTRFTEGFDTADLREARAFLKG